MTTVRLTSEQVRVHGFIYGFSNSDVADQFQTCLLFHALDDCETKFPPLGRHPVCIEIADFELHSKRTNFPAFVPSQAMPWQRL